MASSSEQQQPKRKRAHRPQWRDAVAGACAGACSRTVMAPIERIKLLKQLRGSIEPSNGSRITPNPSAWTVAKEVYETQGFLAFWRGNLPNVIRVAGTAAINMMMMDYYKQAAVAPWFEMNVVQRHSTTTAELQRRRQFWTSFVSGGLAGATSTTILYPIEFLRTRLAMDVGSSDNRQYKGMRNVMRTILKTDGPRGFFQGYGIALSGGVIYRILFLGGYDALKGELLYLKQQNQSRTSDVNGDSSESEPKLTWTERIFSAQFISVTAGTVSYPFDSVRRRMMMQAGLPMAERQYRNSLHCIATIVRQESWKGFYLGIGPNLLRSVGGALLLVAYDTFKVML